MLGWHRYFIILIFSIIFTGQLFGTDELEKQYEYAVKLFKEEQYFDAITEFKRLLYFDLQNKYVYEANEYIGLSYKMGAKFSDAILYFTLAEMHAETNEELFRSKIEIIRVNILRRTTSHAIDLLDSLETNKKFSDRIKEVYYWKGWAYIFADKWKDAASAFNVTDTNKILADFCYTIDREKYSSAFADLISHFIPGAGQIYTGHYVSGILSLGWNILWGFVTVNAFIENRIFDGFVVGNLLWFRFYNGNLQNAVKFADEENLRITNQALQYLQYNYSGLKP